MQIKYSKSAVKIIESLDRETKKRIKSGIEGLTEEPPKGDIKPLRGYDKPLFRLRIGKYRVVYEYNIIDEEQLLIIKDIGSRGDIYK